MFSNALAKAQEAKLAAAPAAACPNGSSHGKAAENVEEAVFAVRNNIELIYAISILSSGHLAPSLTQPSRFESRPTAQLG